MAEALLQLDVGLDLIERYVAWPFDHHRDAGVPGALGQFTEYDQLMDLGAVGGVDDTAGAESVAERQGRVVRLDDLE